MHKVSIFVTVVASGFGTVVQRVGQIFIEPLVIFVHVWDKHAHEEKLAF